MPKYFKKLLHTLYTLYFGFIVFNIHFVPCSLAKLGPQALVYYLQRRANHCYPMPPAPNKQLHHKLQQFAQLTMQHIQNLLDLLPFLKHGHPHKDISKTDLESHPLLHNKHVATIIKYIFTTKDGSLPLDTSCLDTTCVTHSINKP